MLSEKLPFREIWLWDFEFRSEAGSHPVPICMVAIEAHSGRVERLWGGELHRRPPFEMGRESLFVAYYASAEIGCHRVLGWPVPENIVDLYVEFRNLTNGTLLPDGAGLLAALRHFNLPALGALEKDEMRALALRGEPFSESEQQALLAYCESDSRSLQLLLTALLPRLDTPRALVRGRYMAVVAEIERRGIPVDAASVSLLRRRGNSIREALIEQADKGYGVFLDGHFNQERFLQFCHSKGIPWPLLPSGRPRLDDDTFKEQASIYPELHSLHELRKVLAQLRLSELAVGPDGRNRAMLSAFRSKTGRNQPSNTRFIFGLPGWCRGAIRPESGMALAYIDWSQQEFGIAAALSRDEAMQTAYISGDPYLAFAKQTGAVPSSASRESHPVEREQYKACVLAVQYGMGEKSLAKRIGKSALHARRLLEQHRSTYHRYWEWSDACEAEMHLRRSLTLTFGWTLQLGSGVEARTVRNFPMQGNGAEMLRLACCFASEREVRVCAPVHDAILIEADLDGIAQAVCAARSAMSDASAVVLDGFRLRSDFRIIRYPERFAEGSSLETWDRVCRMAQDLDARECTNTRSSVSPRSVSSEGVL